MKHHNNLTDGQIHNAKGFEPARKRSISTKNSVGEVEWTKANYTSVVTLTPVADVEAYLHHSYFCLYNSNDVAKYAVYINISGGSAMATPTGYDGVIAADVTASGAGSTAVQVGTAIQVALNAHSSFTASVNGSTGVVTISGLTTASPALVATSSFGITIADTEVADEVLTTNSSGNIKWVSKSDFSTEIENVEGTEVKSTGETGGTKFLREDGDGTCSWQTVAGDITSVSIAGGTGEKIYASGVASFTIAGGTGITTSVSGSTITVSETEEKKKKEDIDDLTGVTETDLGTFTGATISDSRKIKEALQDLETKAETEATDTVKGIAKFNSSDFGTPSGEVRLATAFRVPAVSEYHRMQGFVSTGTNNYKHGEDIQDSKSPYEMAVDYGHNAVNSGSLTPTKFTRIGQAVYIHSASTLYDIKGFLTSNGSNSVTVAICKLSPVMYTSSGDENAVQPILMDEVSATGLSSHEKIVALADDGGFDNTALAAGDIIFPMVKEAGGAGSIIHFNLVVQTLITA